MKHTKQEKQLINEHLKMFVLDRPCGMLSATWLEQFQKQHNLIDDELEVGKWYRHKNRFNSLYFLYKKDGFGFESYGIHLHNEWLPNVWHRDDNENLLEVPESYVIERLTWYAEQVMKYNHEKPNYKCLILPDESEVLNGNLRYFIDNDGFCIQDISNFATNCLMKDGVWAETFEVEQPIKPAYKSKGGEHGKRVIEKLVELGGVKYQSSGCFERAYYYIDSDNTIVYSYHLPQGYTECFLDEQPQTITIKIPKGLDYKIEVI
jgi:hypothetical protein